MALPAHQRLPEDDTDDDLSDEQISLLLDEAERSLRAKQAQIASPDAPFTLPKLQPGHIADAYLTTKGAVTKLDPSKLINKEHKALAEGIKKINDPIHSKRQKLEVRTAHFSSTRQ
jgi:hypothetical protein